MAAPSPAASPIRASAPTPPPTATQAIFQSVVLVALSASTVACCRGLLPASMSAVAYAITSLAIILATSFMVGTMMLPKIVRRLQVNKVDNKLHKGSMQARRGTKFGSKSTTQVLPLQEHEVLDNVGTVVLDWYKRARKNSQELQQIQIEQQQEAVDKCARDEVDRLEEQNERNRAYRAALLEENERMLTLIATYRAALLEAAGKDAVADIEKAAAAQAKQQGVERGSADQGGAADEEVTYLAIETPRRPPQDSIRFSRPRRVSTTDMRTTGAAHEMISEAQDTERCAVGMPQRTSIDSVLSQIDT